ncbi:hypothetical protein [Bacillus sp. CHD6a]|uniref:hypothetical protein n=1 Tax=Bacillus sp. CHD6a TaxID=1643452 RepID=UPI00076196A7|nr:hypothetical protein [Bacillus sp. CHD6a]
MKSTLLRCIGAAILWGGFQAIFFLSVKGEVIFSDIILKFGFSEVSINLVYLIELSIQFLPFFIFQILFGTVIYQHFCSASIYYFSRCHHRGKWFLKESLKLYSYSLIYPLTMVGFATIIASSTNEILFDQASIILFFYYLAIHSLWLFITALLMNIMSIRFDSSIGFMVIVGFQLFCVSMLLLWEDVSLTNQSAFFLKLNPISHLILSWHNSNNLGLNDRINFLNIDLSLNASILYFFILCLLSVGSGLFIVKKQEWITLNKE